MTDHGQRGNRMGEIKFRSTGATDKNGVEICEGYTVECPDFYNYTDGSSGTVKNAVIEYCEVTARWWVEFEGDCREMSLWTYSDLTSGLEVIQNPELLEG